MHEKIVFTKSQASGFFFLVMRKMCEFFIHYKPRQMPVPSTNLYSILYTEMILYGFSLKRGIKQDTPSPKELALNVGFCPPYRRSSSFFCLHDQEYLENLLGVFRL